MKNSTKKQTSRLARARGLKLDVHAKMCKTARVAPRAGAWIETRRARKNVQDSAGRASRGRVD